MSPVLFPGTLPNNCDVCQIIVYIIRLNVPWHMHIVNNVRGFPYVALQVLLVLCGMWSLDFFALLFHHFV